MTDPALPDQATVTVTVLDDPATRGPYADIPRRTVPRLFEGTCEPDDVVIYNGANTCLRFCADGRVYVRGNLVDTDREVYDGIRKLLGLGVKREDGPAIDGEDEWRPRQDK